MEEMLPRFAQRLRERLLIFSHKDRSRVVMVVASLSSDPSRGQHGYEEEKGTPASLPEKALRSSPGVLRKWLRTDRADCPKCGTKLVENC